MPPEPSPWDRKDFSKERRNERSDSSFGSAPRWRESSTTSSSSHHLSRNFFRCGSAEFRTPGHGKQGGLHKDSSNGYVSCESNDKMLEDENFRLTSSCGDGKYRRSARESRRSVVQKDWGSYSLGTGNESPNAPGRRNGNDQNNVHRSVDDMLTYPSHPQSDFVNSWDQHQSKDQHDKKKNGINGLTTDQRCERENSLGSMDWKPLKWARSGSLSSRGSGLSNSSSSKSLGGMDSSEMKTDLPPKGHTPVQSPSGDAAACVTSALMWDETSSRKKPRLGWGEGLAKYEKKKVEGPDIIVSKDAAVLPANSTEAAHSFSSNFADKSPGIMGFSDCASPATPSSVACSSSPGVEEKSFGKTPNVDSGVSTLCVSPSFVAKNHLMGFSFNLEKFDINAVATLGSSLNEFIQFDDPASVDSCFVRSTAVNKLLVCKGDVLKTLELTESEIDSLENELKTLKSESRSLCSLSEASSCLLVDGNVNLSINQKSCSAMVFRPTPLQVDSCMDATVADKMPVNGGLEVHIDAKNEDIESPGTATSKFVEPQSFAKIIPPSNEKTQVEGVAVDGIQSTLNEENNHVYSCGDGVLMHCEIGANVPSEINLHVDGENTLHNIILASNKELARNASEVFDKLLPKEYREVDVSRVSDVIYCEDDQLIKEKFGLRKKGLRFKERLLTLKFKAFHHLWKEDMRLLSIRNSRFKPPKKYEFSFRSTHGGYQKHRSSIRSRFSSPGNLSLVPTTEIINFTNKLLSDSHVKRYRDDLRMPSLILDEKEKLASMFVSSNGFVEDPDGVEKEKDVVNQWTPEETEIFLDSLLLFGKNFSKIASLLDHKTTADCVVFYYRNQKSDCFERVKKKWDIDKQGKTFVNTFMVSSGKKWNREIDAASLDILGAASAMAAHSENVTGDHQDFTGRIFMGGQYYNSRSSQLDDGCIERPDSFDILQDERETVAADVLAGICGSMSSEAMSSCITSSVDPGEGNRDRHYRKIDSATKRYSTSDITENVDDDTSSDESYVEMDTFDWTDEEKSMFVKAFSSYGKDFAMISRCIRTKSRDQCNVFFSKAHKCLRLDSVPIGNVRHSVSDDENGDGSDMEDVCALGNSSVICNDIHETKINENLPPASASNIDEDESDSTRAINLITDGRLFDKDRFDEDNCLSLLGHRDAVKTLSSDVCETENKSELMLKNGDDSNNIENGCGSTQNLVNVVEVDDAEAERGEVVGASCAPSQSSNMIVQSQIVADSLVETCASTEGNNHNDLKKVSNAIKIASLSAVDTSSSGPIELDFRVTPPLTREKSHVPANHATLTTREKSHVLANHATLTTSIVKPVLGNCSDDRLLPKYASHGGKQINTSADVGSHDQHVLAPSHEKHVESFQILDEFSLQIPAMKGKTGDICRKLSYEVQGMSKSDMGSGPRLAQECYLRKCNSAKPKGSGESQNLEHANLSDTERPCKNGNVKLFGKILTAQENEDKSMRHSRQSNKPPILKLNDHHTLDGNPGTKIECSNQFGLENVPVRSYGFWDGSRIQTGFSALPDSAIFLSKYPAAFGNYTTPSSKLDQQPLQAVLKGEHGNLNGVSVFPRREINGKNAVIDYQLYRNGDGSKLQSFSVDMKQRQDILSEMQRRNGFETVSSLQQHGRGGMSVVGRGGILVSGQCTGVSDPVAAIKMHYAKTDKYGASDGNIIREEESWRNKGDVGR